MDYINIYELAEQVERGEVDPLEAFAKMKEYQKDLKDSMSMIEEYAMEEAAKHGKNFDLYGYSFTQKQGGRNWDFSTVPEIVEAEKNLKELKESAKSAWENNNRNIMSVHSGTGEVVALPTLKFKKDSLVVTKNHKDVVS